MRRVGAYASGYGVVRDSIVSSCIQVCQEAVGISDTRSAIIFDRTGSNENVQFSYPITAVEMYLRLVKSGEHSNTYMKMKYELFFLCRKHPNPIATREAVATPLVTV